MRELVVRERDAREPAVFARDSVVRGALLREEFAREVVAREVVARRGVVAVRFVAVRFVADERVARLGVGLRGVMVDPRSLTSLHRSSRADRGTLRAARDRHHQLLPTPEQLLLDQLKQSQFHFPGPFPLRLLQRPDELDHEDSIAQAAERHTGHVRPKSGIQFCRY